EAHVAGSHHAGTHAARAHHSRAAHELRPHRVRQAAGRERERARARDAPDHAEDEDRRAGHRRDDAGDLLRVHRDASSIARERALNSSESISPRAYRSARIDAARPRSAVAEPVPRPTVRTSHAMPATTNTQKRTIASHPRPKPPPKPIPNIIRNTSCSVVAVTMRRAGEDRLRAV